MRRRLVLALAPLLALAACGTPVSETVAGAAPIGTDWHLKQVDGAAFGQPFTMAFQSDGSLVGQGPCNGFTARQSLPLPWFQATSLSTEKRSCPAAEAEARALAILAEMEFAEVKGETLLLTGGTSHSMLFTR